MKWLQHLKNVPIAIFFGFALGLGISMLLGSDIDEELKRYGTYFMTATMTLVASGIALATTIWNSEAVRERKLYAAKASLPMALSKLTSVAKSGFKYSTYDLSYFNDLKIFQKLKARSKFRMMYFHH